MSSQNTTFSSGKHPEVPWKLVICDSAIESHEICFSYEKTEEKENETYTERSAATWH